MITIRPETPADIAPRERLLDSAFGKSRRRKTSERLREGRLPAQGLAFSAADETGKLIGTLRLWEACADSGQQLLLLGPLAVDGRHQRQGIGAALMRHALGEARRLGHHAVILVGDAPYYARFGFTHAPTQKLKLPGPVDPERFLGLELVAGALAAAGGLVSGCGQRETHRQTAA